MNVATFMEKLFALNVKETEKYMEMYANVLMETLKLDKNTALIYHLSLYLEKLMMNCNYM